MKNLTKNSILILSLFMALIQSTNAESVKPSWIEKLPRNDGSFNYYIGRSTGSISEAEAFTQATINAREQAITQNYGVYTQFRTENYQSVDTSQSTQNSEAISQQVRLEEFEQVDFFQENQSERKNVWVLFKYKKSAIEFEKNRLKHLKNNKDDSYKFMISGNQEGAKINGTLEVTSSPSGAPVRIDGKSNIGDLELRTPLRLMGLFMAGKHTIEIDDPKYELIQKEIILYPGTTAKVDELLQRSFGEISISSETEGATVFLGTKPIGTTPLEHPIKIMAENSASIEVRHPEMETYRLQTQVSRGEKKIEYIKLVARPSTISISSDPRGAEVEINGIHLTNTTPTGQNTISNGTHRLKISKDGYKDYETNFDIKGGENLVLGNVKLEQIQTGRLIGIEKFKDTSLSLNGKEYKVLNDQLILNPGVYELKILKSGYEKHESKIIIQEGKSVDISYISLKESPVVLADTPLTKTQKLMNPTWTFGIGYLFSQSTFKEVNYNAKALALSFRIMPWNRLGLDLGVFNGETTFDNKSSTGPNMRETKMIKYGMPFMIYRPEWIANDSIFLVPEYVHVTNTFNKDNQTSNSTSNNNSKEYPEMTLKQAGKGVSIEYRSFCHPVESWRSVVGVSFKTGIHEYKNTGKLTGSKAVSTSIELIFGF